MILTIILICVLIWYALLYVVAPIMLIIFLYGLIKAISE